MELPPPAIMVWKVRSWIQYLLDDSVAYQSKKSIIIIMFVINLKAHISTPMLIVGISKSQLSKGHPTSILLFYPLT